MKKGLCHLCWIVDRSGSMTKIAKDMIGGYNSFIKKQKEVPSECFVSFYQFDDIYETVFERVNLQDVKDLDDKTYIPRNSTALYDALGRTINDYGKYLSLLKEEERPERILFVTISDGEDNVSTHFTLEQVRNMIKHQTETYSWDFVFLGSNIDAWDAGHLMGISTKSVLQFASVGPSVGAAFDALSKGSTHYRTSMAKSAYAFDSQDLKEQDQFLDDKLKSKNKQKQEELNKKV